MIISLDFLPSTALTVSATQIAVGVCMVEEDAFIAGFNADPFESGDQPGWLYRSVGVARENANGLDPYRVRADVRGRRRIQGSNRLVLMTQSAAFGVYTTASYRCGGIVRTLLLLP